MDIKHIERVVNLKTEALVKMSLAMAGPDIDWIRVQIAVPVPALESEVQALRDQAAAVVEQELGPEWGRLGQMWSMPEQDVKGAVSYSAFYTL